MAPDEFRKSTAPMAVELATEAHGNVRWLVRSSAAPSRLGEIVADPDRFLTLPEFVVADSPLITLGRIPPRDPGEPALMLRRLNYGRLSHRFRDVFRATRAERAFQSAIGLEQAGVATARALAVGVDRAFRWPRRAYLITEWISDAITLEQRLADGGRLSRHEVVQLADLLAGLHKHGFSHRDLKSSNILFNQRGSPGFIDLDGVRQFRVLRETRAVADLARLAWEFRKCQPEFLKWNFGRFLQRYCHRRGFQDIPARWPAKILAPTRQRLAAGMDYWKT